MGLFKALVLALCIYRLLFHPLRQYPGPLGAKLSSLYGAFYAFRTNIHVRTWQDHAEYEQDIYQNERVTKSYAYLVTQKSPDVYGLFNDLNKYSHQRRRKLMGVALNDRSTREFEPTMINRIDTFIHQLLLSCRQEPAATINMTERIGYLTMDIIGYFIFGYSLNLQTELTNRHMTNNSPNLFLNLALQYPFLGNIRFLKHRYLRFLLRGSPYSRTLGQMIRHCLAQGWRSKDDLIFMTDRLQVPEDDDEFVEEIRSEATFLLSAGSTTISTWLSAVFFYLSQNQRCYERLRQEIRSAFRDGREIRSGQRLANCGYLRACLDEALRMTPPIPGTLWREQTAETKTKAENLLIDGHLIPPGTQIGVNIYSIHRNPDCFPEPFVFKPERFMADDTAPRKASRDGFTPFSLGSRACIGKSMAYQEASLVVAKVIWYFDFDTAKEGGESGKLRPCEPGCERGGIGEFLIHDLFGATHNGPFLKFRHREDLEDVIEGLEGR
ncbi:cytochrome P450 [Xylariaceae sp. FL0662B]|nr:cytochrome P450 [Xylariaceae sp. FL0662B]